MVLVAIMPLLLVIVKKLTYLLLHFSYNTYQWWWA